MHDTNAVVKTHASLNAGAACINSTGADARCLVKNDNAFKPFTGTLVLSALNVNTSTTIEIGRVPIVLGVGAGAAQWLCAPSSDDSAPPMPSGAAGAAGTSSSRGSGSPFTGCKPWADRFGTTPIEQLVLLTKLIADVPCNAGCVPEHVKLKDGKVGCCSEGREASSDAGSDHDNGGGAEAVVYSSFELLAIPTAMLPHMHYATVTATVGGVATAATPTAAATVSISVVADAAALFVGLTTAAHGRFSENFFVMPAGTVTVEFVPFGDLDLDLLASTLRVEHVKSYV